MAIKESFIDVEELVKWTYNNPTFFGTDSNCLFGENTANKWKKYETTADVKSIKIINSTMLNDKEKFEVLSISDLIICINGAKDHSRGKRNPELIPITSTGKKVFILLILGRILDDESRDKYFMCSNKKDIELCKYLNKFNKSINKKNDLKYLPGRTVSYAQICNAANYYKNYITADGIQSGLQDLEKINLVECVDKSNKFWKLNFKGCKQFLEANK